MLNYNAPAKGQKSSIDSSNSDQMQTFLWLRKAMIEARDQEFFQPLASSVNLPKHYGDTVKMYEYIPLLDDRNINDQGIDANGVTIANGNLYGSSKDVGTITGSLPHLTENGGRVNRVGFKRTEISGSIHNVGFFYEFTEDSLQFDSDDQLKEHLSREAVNGAYKMTEQILQIDLLMASTSIVYAGAATSNSDITGEGATPSLLSYDNLIRLDALLTKHKTDKHTKVITGSRNVDTRVIPSARIAYAGPETVRELKRLKDGFDRPAFIPIQQYADAGTALNGEVGSIDAFRIIENPEMLRFAGEGAVVGTNPGYFSSTKNGQDRYDVFPLLVVGNDSFATIGFQTDGESYKFKIMTKMPGKDTMGHHDPYGKTGLTSIQWWYGFLAKRKNRIGLAKFVVSR